MENREMAVRLFESISTLYALPDCRKMAEYSRGELLVLLTLEKCGPLTPGQLIHITDSSSAHVAKIIRKLTSKGLVSRNTDPEDKRRVVVELTEEGHQTARKQYEQIIDQVAGLMNSLGEEKSRQVISAIDDVIRIIRNRKEAGL